MVNIKITLIITTMPEKAVIKKGTIRNFSKTNLFYFGRTTDCSVGIQYFRD